MTTKIVSNCRISSVICLSTSAGHSSVSQNTTIKPLPVNGDRREDIDMSVLEALWHDSHILQGCSMVVASASMHPAVVRWAYLQGMAVLGRKPSRPAGEAMAGGFRRL